MNKTDAVNVVARRRLLKFKRSVPKIEAIRPYYWRSNEAPTDGVMKVRPRTRNLERRRAGALAPPPPFSATARRRTRSPSSGLVGTRDVAAFAARGLSTMPIHAWSRWEAPRRFPAQKISL